MTENNRPKIGGLLLAAGGSRRLGRPKQLLEFEGKTLVRAAAEALIEAGCDPVVVVLGAEIEGSRNELDGLDVVIVENSEWEEGMSSSIRVGIDRFLELEKDIDAVLISLCDQPNVTADKLSLFIYRYSNDRPPIIAAEYDGVAGVPALFDRNVFRSLMDIRGDKGAREIIRNFLGAMTISLPEATFDIDTPADIA
ncbi:MAG: nucleotidyltransferase family protein [Blastocatellia bacterium]|nr:nucleotidyltransferase family protein [Blastocatellia bacterium]